jgi:hypothetical protein
MIAWELGKPRRKWDDNIKLDLKNIGCEDVRRVELIQDRIQWRELALLVLNLGFLLP